MDDLRAVMDAAGSARAALIGVSEGGPISMLFAATYPGRVSHLVVYGGYARWLQAPDYPHGPTPEEREASYRFIEESWGGEADLAELAPSVMNDPVVLEWWARYLRSSASPGAAVALLKMNSLVDIRPLLPSIRVPTLVIHRTGDRDIVVGNGRHIAAHIPGARIVELPGDDHLWWAGDADAILAEVEEFVTGQRPAPEPDRVLATVLLTDLVGSTETAVRLGDARWRDLLEAHSDRVRKEIDRFRGRELDSAGDGFLSTFDGPARAVRAGLAIAAAAAEQGLQVRAGVHTGECLLDAESRLRGATVHVGARIAALAGPGEVLVSQTVKDLVSGSGLSFEDRGLHALKGVGEWRVFRSLGRGGER